MDGLVRSLAIGVGWNVDNEGLIKANEETDGLVDNAENAEGAVDQLGATGDESGGLISGAFEKASDKISDATDYLEDMRFKLGAIATAVGGSAFAFANWSGDIEESVNTINREFGSASNTILDFARDYSNSTELSENLVLDWTKTLGLNLRMLNLSSDETASLTKEMIELSHNFSHFMDMSPEQAFSSLHQAIRGGRFPRALRDITGQVRQTDIENRAMTMGLIEQGEEMDQQAERIATLSMLQEELAITSGAAAAGQYEFNTRLTSFKNALRDTSIALGNQYRPALSEGLKLTADFLNEFKESEWIAPLSRIGALTGSAAGLAAGIGTLSWVAGKFGIAGGFAAVKLGLLILTLEDLWSFFKGDESITGDILEDLKPFADELNGVASEIQDTSTGLGKMIAGGFWNKELFNEGKKEFEEGYNDLELRFKSWTNSFTGWVEEEFNIQSILEDKFSFAKERPDWVPEKLDWWGEDGMDIEPINFGKMKDDLSKSWNKTWSELNESWDESIEPLLIKFKWPNIKDNIQEEWNEFKDWWDELEIGFDFEMPDFKGMIDEQLNKLPDWSKELLNIGSEVIEKESKNISNNNKTETNVNDNSVNVEKGAINIQGATDPKAVGKEVKKQLNSYIKLQAGEVGAN